MAITDLDTQIRAAFAQSSKLYSVFLDMENAFPRVWKHLIHEALYKAGLKGPLPTTLLNFLQSRTFQVRIGNHFSSCHPQTNGIPQGSPLSATLFILAINDILSTIPPPIRSIIYVDDLSLHLPSSHPPRAQRLLQTTINDISSWLTKHGFRISPPKSQLVIFQKRRSISSPLPKTYSLATPQSP